MGSSTIFVAGEPILLGNIIVTVQTEPGGEDIVIEFGDKSTPVSRHWTTKTTHPQAQHKFYGHRVDEVARLLGIDSS